MRPSLISIDEDVGKVYGTVDANSIDAYICALSFNVFGFAERTVSYVMSKPHIIDLCTKNHQTWEKLVEVADVYYWVADANYGLAVYDPDETCGFTRVYRIQERRSQLQDKSLRSSQHYKTVRTEDDVHEALSDLERVVIFTEWKKHQEAINLPLGMRSDGRLKNTTVSSSVVVTGGNGCVVCGKSASHVASTTIGGLDAKMVSIALCESDWLEVQKRPCVLDFISSLFHLKIDLPKLIKYDSLPEEIVKPIVNMVAEELGASASIPEQRKNGWSAKFVMPDGWYWMLRLRSFTDYAYMLFDKTAKQRHRIDSADHHPEVPFGPNHQHYDLKTRKEKITPSFSYGVPLLDFPLLLAARKEYNS